MRDAEFDLYKRKTESTNELAGAFLFVFLDSYLKLARNVTLFGVVPIMWRRGARDVAQSLACAYALGWNAQADRLGELIPSNILMRRPLWTEEDYDPRWEKAREPFVRFALALYADFAGVSLPEMPPHPYESPVYDAMLACWRQVDPESIVEPLLNVCDWHTHECMYSQSDRPSKSVDFINDTLMGWPIEVHMIYRLRERLGLALPQTLDHPLMRTPLGLYRPPQPIPKDPIASGLILRLYEEVPGLRDVLGSTLDPAIL
jgi:hypothetical protein